VDLLPTVLDALGIPQPAALDGSSLWPALTRRKQLPERPLIAHTNLYGPELQALVQWPYKLILHTETGRYALFNLESDPRETEDLSETQARRLSDLLARLRTMLPPETPSAADQREVELDEDIRRELRSLGYLN
jgi:arylsulfatase A-like enzyme